MIHTPELGERPDEAVPGDHRVGGGEEHGAHRRDRVARPRGRSRPSRRSPPCRRRRARRAPGRWRRTAGRIRRPSDPITQHDDHRRDDERHRARARGSRNRRCNRRARRGTPTARRRTARAAASAARRRRARTRARRRTSARRAPAPAAGCSATAATTSATNVAGLQTYSTRCHGARRPIVRAATPIARSRRRPRREGARCRPWVHDPTPCQTGPMAFHHVAITTKDLDATHRFYTEAMGFELVKVEAAPDTREPGGPGTSSTTPATARCSRSGTSTTTDARRLPTPRSRPGSACRRGRTTSRSTSPDLDDLKVKLERWLDYGLDCVRIDHGWCTSIYADDPNGITVEFCASTREFTDDRPRRGASARSPRRSRSSTRPSPRSSSSPPTQRVGASRWTSHPAPDPTS